MSCDIMNLMRTRMKENELPTPSDVFKLVVSHFERYSTHSSTYLYAST